MIKLLHNILQTKNKEPDVCFQEFNSGEKTKCRTQILPAVNTVCKLIVLLPTLLSHLCEISPLDKKHSCKCPEGDMAHLQKHQAGQEN